MKIHRTFLPTILLVVIGMIFATPCFSAATTITSITPTSGPTTGGPSSQSMGLILLLTIITIRVMKAPARNRGNRFAAPG